MFVMESLLLMSHPEKCDLMLADDDVMMSVWTVDGTRLE
jgi:hypothetical protein